MKSLVLAAVLTVALSTAMRAQSDSSASADREIYAWGGTTYSYLPGESKDLWKNGWNAGVGYGCSFAPGDIGYAEVYASVEYDRFPFNETGYRNWLLPQFPAANAQEITTGINIARGTLKYVTAMVNFKGTFSSTKQSLAPYFLIGVGYIYKTSDSIAIAGNSAYTIEGGNQSGFAWSVGLGIELPFADRFALFAQGRTVLGVFDPTRQYFPVSGGVRVRL